MIKIYSSGKIIRLITDQAYFEQLPGSILVNIASKKELEEYYTELISSHDLQNIYFYHPDKRELFNYFKSMFRVIEAAGGIVRNDKEEYLFIFRNGKWDLPKGKLEKKETIEDAAVREVEEECGTRKLKIKRELPTTYHTYFLEEKPVLKPTYWFEMSSSDHSELTPQIEEGITKVAWFPKSKWDIIRENTYESILDVLKNVG